MMKDKKNRKVIYLNKEYEIIHIYESGYCELKESLGWNYLLVPLADLQLNLKITLEGQLIWGYEKYAFCGWFSLVIKRTSFECTFLLPVQIIENADTRLFHKKCLLFSQIIKILIHSLLKSPNFPQEYGKYFSLLIKGILLNIQVFQLLDNIYHLKSHKWVKNWFLLMQNSPHLLWI